MAQAPAQLKRIFRSSPHQQANHDTGKKGMLANPGSILVGIFGCGFVGYVFNVRGMGTRLDAWFSGLNHAAQGHEKQVANAFLWALPAIGVAMLLLLFSILRGTISTKKKPGKKAKKPGKTAVTAQAAEVRGVEVFVETAAEAGVSPKVARAAYRLLLPHVRKGKHLRAGDSLCRDLKVQPERVSDLYGTLLRHTDRRRKPGDNAGQLRTAMDLMTAVQASEDKSVPTATVLAFKAAAAAGPVAVAMEAEAMGTEQPKAKKPSAVLVHPARLSRRELSMIRARATRG